MNFNAVLKLSNASFSISIYNYDIPLYDTDMIVWRASFNNRCSCKILQYSSMIKVCHGYFYGHTRRPFLHYLQDSINQFLFLVVLIGVSMFIYSILNTRPQHWHRNDKSEQIWEISALQLSLPKVQKMLCSNCNFNYYWLQNFFTLMDISSFFASIPFNNSSWFLARIILCSKQSVLK